MRFEWDSRKAATNKRRHGVSFEEAVTCFADPLAVMLEDRKHVERAVLIGVSQQSRLIFTVFIELAEEVIRVISARRATKHERRRYEEGTD